MVCVCVVLGGGSNFRGVLNKAVGGVSGRGVSNFRGGVNNPWGRCWIGYAALATTFTRRCIFAMIAIHKCSKGKAACKL